MKEARRVQENKERAEEFRAEQEAAAAERAKAQAEADALAAAELDKVIQQEAADDSWGWGEGDGRASGERLLCTCPHPSFMVYLDHLDASCIAVATEGDANAAPENSEVVEDARVEQAIDSGIASLSAGFASSLEAFSEVRSLSVCYGCMSLIMLANAGRISCGEKHGGGKDGAEWGVAGNWAECRRSSWRRRR